ncbi:MAG: (deoxy)nucleoside triphosphate pyrophosphohydrolase [Desulfuromonas sp.]|nr:MAG: (deoxy)nucleoside triphosphate pyrophosphohydrolase [Desulfuromonas sp.]
MSLPLLVTAAIAIRDDRVLITQRMPGSRHAGMWEFPGGKMEKNESPTETLQREICEELGVEVQVEEIFAVIHHRYEWGAILLLAYRCQLEEKPLQHLEVADHRWVTPQELDDYPLLDADRPLVEKLQSGLI